MAATKVASSRADRATSYDIADFAVPSGREEEWRFTPVKRLQALFEPAGPGSALTLEAEGGTWSAPGGPRPARVGSPVIEAVGRNDPRLGQTAPPSDRAAAAAWAGLREAHVVTIPAQTEAATPVRLLYTGSGDAAATAAHLVVIAEPGSKATVIVDHVGLAVATQTVELHVGPGADLTLVALHQWSRGSVHNASHRARLAEGARLKHVSVSLGGDLVRLTPEVVFAGPGGDAELLGLYLTDSGQHHEARLFVDHAAPRCKSRVTYKGALQGAGAHSVWVGDVLIRHAAQGTDTYELNRNLVLVRGARADSVPNLEIETGEIEGAGHASATGRFDDEQLFYLMSRGIDRDMARRLVVHGFFAELIAKIGDPELERHLVRAVDARLDAALEESGL
jgi:Fe-S cluster assembly protein SufD